MKKILLLLFFSVAFFVFILAGSAQADVQPAVTAVTISLPTDGELNYQTTKPITWTYSGIIGVPKFDISLIEAVGTVTAKPVATQVLCKTQADGSCAYPWRVGSLRSSRFLMGVDYKIRVCVAGANPAVCRDSATAFKIIPPALKNQQEVLNLFKTAMSNRYGSLSSQGVSGYILGNGTAGSSKIPTATANQAKVYNNILVIDRLNWFKDQFLPNTGGVLTATNKQSIQQAMVGRYTDFCVADWKTAINGLTRVYQTNVTNGVRAVPAKGTVAAVLAVPSYQQVLNTAVRNCNSDYNKNITCKKGVACTDKKGVRIKYSDGITDVPTTKGMTAKNSDYNNATIRYVEQEGYMNERDGCTAAAYVKFNQDKVIALTTLTNGKAAADSTYNSCVGNSRISGWGWEEIPN